MKVIELASCEVKKMGLVVTRVLKSFIFFSCSCLRNPASFLTKKDLFRSTQPDNMEDGLLASAVSVTSDSGTPLPNPVTGTGNSYEAVG